MKKKVYFVRHGQVQSNVDYLVQDHTERLTEKGRHQAAIVAQRFKDIEIDTIISSSYERALETAQEIEFMKRAGIVMSDLFVEVKNPSEYIGRKRNDKEIIENLELRRARVDDLEWHYSDEENFHDISKRGQEAFKFLEAREEECLLVVTHGYFVRVLLSIILLQRSLPGKLFYEIADSLITSNTGITYCTYDSERERPWKLVSWNDFAHLGEIER